MSKAVSRLKRCSVLRIPAILFGLLLGSSSLALAEMAPPDPDHPSSLNPELYSRDKTLKNDKFTITYIQPPVPQDRDPVPSQTGTVNRTNSQAFSEEITRHYVAELHDDVRQREAEIGNDQELGSLIGSTLELDGPDREAESLPLPISADTLPLPIGMIGSAIAPDSGQLPIDRAADWFAEFGTVYQDNQSTRGWYARYLPWTAPSDRHQPLYFEDINLERCGYHFGCVQPFVSAAKFYGRVPWAVYMEVAQPCGECAHDLGKYRPGSPSCPTHQRPRLYLPAAAVEAFWVAGLILLVP